MLQQPYSGYFDLLQWLSTICGPQFHLSKKILYIEFSYNKKIMFHIINQKDQGVLLNRQLHTFSTLAAISYSKWFPILKVATYSGKQQKKTIRQEYFNGKKRISRTPRYTLQSVTLCLTNICSSTHIYKIVWNSNIWVPISMCKSYRQETFMAETGSLINIEVNDFLVWFHPNCLQSRSS